MCKEDIRVSRKFGTAYVRQGAVNGTYTAFLKARSDRTRLIVAAEINTSVNQTITGNIDPATGNVGETLAYNIPLAIVVTFPDGNGHPALAVLSRESPVAVMRVEEYGNLITNPIELFNGSGFNVNVTVSECWTEQDLGEI